jgi:hypothetical protein
MLTLDHIPLELEKFSKPHYIKQWLKALGEN